jgi:hypothetical protein
VDFPARVGGNRMTRIAQFFLRLLVALCVASSFAGAQTIAVSGAASPLNIASAIAGSELMPASSNNSTYSVTTTTANQKIVAHVEPALPAYVTLTVTLAAPGSGSSAGPVQLSATDQTLVNAIVTPATYTGLAIHYTLTATVRAGVMAATTYHVVFSVVEGPTETVAESILDRTREIVRSGNRAGDRW